MQFIKIKQFFNTLFAILFKIIGIITCFYFIQGKNTTISKTDFQNFMILSVILTIIKEIYDYHNTKKSSAKK